jgi:PKD repeat protein
MKIRILLITLIQFAVVISSQAKGFAFFNEEINPTINITAASTNLHACYGNSSSIKMFAINAVNINATVSIHATKHLELSFNQNVFDTATINLIPVDNIIGNTAIYFRLKENAAVGIYKDTILINSSIQDSYFIILSDTVYAAPATHFNNPSVCLGVYAQFKDSSSIADGNLVSWKWDFGDSINSSLINPSHYYVVPGNYIVKLTVTSSFGCSKESTDVISVFPRPRAKIAVSNSGCANTQVFFSDSSALNGSILKSWKWSFGDSIANNSSNNQHVAHAYSNAGMYTICLRVTTDKGCADSTSIGILINPATNAPLVNNLVSFCEGTKTRALQVNVTKGYSLLWYQQAADGSATTDAPIPSTSKVGTTDYFVCQQNNSTGCISERSKISVVVNPLPLKPIITPDNNNNLSSSADLGNQWFSMLSANSVDTNQVFKPLSNGDYYVQVAQNGCVSAKSDVYHFMNSNNVQQSTSNEWVTVFPNPVFTDFKVDYKLATNNVVVAELFNVNQILIAQKIITSGTNISMAGNLSGNYILRLVDSKTNKLLYTCHILKVK